MTDLRYPASVSENIVRALRKVAEDFRAAVGTASTESEGDVTAGIAVAFRRLADELEAGKPETDINASLAKPRGLPLPEAGIPARHEECS